MHALQVARYRDAARVAEGERDNLRDAVKQLAERVESSRSLPRPQLSIPQLLEPLDPPPVPLPGDPHLWTYASTTIVSLRAALTAEQQAHKETRRISRAQITLLEAQLARQQADHAAADISENTEAANARLAVEVAQLAAKMNVQRAIALDADPDRTVRPRQRAASAPGSSGAPYLNTAGTSLPYGDTSVPMDDHNALEREIAGLGARVEALRQERALLWEQVRAAKDEERSTPDAALEPLPRVRRPPTPGPRLHPQTLTPDSSIGLPPSPPAPRSASPDTSPSRSPPIPLEDEEDQTQRPNPSESLLDWDGEQSMELATPLVPSVALPTASAHLDVHLAVTDLPASPENYALLPAAGPSPIFEVGSLTP
ncbi:hypothetical protein C8F01DRAFT_71559 [Mycena amicta]|nr:hypothetical protein C8F01DRAFT_71559 [Mycena amicta]